MTDLKFLIQQFQQLASKFRDVAQRGELPTLQTASSFHQYIQQANLCKQAFDLWELAYRAADLVALLPPMDFVEALQIGRRPGAEQWFRLVESMLGPGETLSDPSIKSAEICELIACDLIRDLATGPYLDVTFQGTRLKRNGNEEIALSADEFTLVSTLHHAGESGMELRDILADIDRTDEQFRSLVKRANKKLGKAALLATDGRGVWQLDEKVQ